MTLVELSLSVCWCYFNPFMKHFVCGELMELTGNTLAVTQRKKDLSLLTLWSICHLTEQFNTAAVFEYGHAANAGSYILLLSVYALNLRFPSPE